MSTTTIKHEWVLVAAGVGAAALLLAQHYLLTTHYEKAADKLRQMRDDERRARTNGEKQKRRNAHAKHQHQDAPLQYRPVGIVHSCYGERRGTPRQGLLAPSARSRLELDARLVQPQALQGIEQFSHVWLLYSFHENTNALKPQQQVRAKVHPPALGGAATGLFSTRTPHRPNAIGLTVARLLGVSGNSLLLGGADLLDRTPVLDIKPYLLHDVQADATVPPWCERVDVASLVREVRFSPSAQASLDAAAPSLEFYADDAPLAQRAIEETLRLDIRSVHQGRGQAGSGKQCYEMCFDRLRVEFWTYKDYVQVTRCELAG